MALTAAEVVRLARLARMEISPEEIERFRAQLGNVLEHMRVLEEIDLTEDVPPENREPVRLRADESHPDRLYGTIETLSADVAGGFFTVPRALPTDGAAS